jgi:hypothetical protein
MTDTNTLTIDLTAVDTLFGHALSHEFKETVHVPGLKYSKTVGLLTLEIEETDGVVTFTASVIGAKVWGFSFSEKGVHTVHETLGSGSIVGTITIA